MPSNNPIPFEDMFRKVTINPLKTKISENLYFMIGFQIPNICAKLLEVHQV